MVVNAEEQNEYKENIEQWRIYSKTDSHTSTLKALLYSFDGEDAVLGVRCENSQPELYFMLGDRLSTKMDSALVLKADGVLINMGKWQRSSQGNGAFSMAPLAILSQFQDKTGLILTYKTEQGKYQVSAFYLNGIKQITEKLATICKVRV